MNKQDVTHGFIILLCIASVIVLLSWLKFLYYPVITGPEGYRYIVKSGTSVRSVIDDLFSKRVLHDRWYCNFLVRSQAKGDFKAGEYFFPEGSSQSSLLTQMINGKGMVYHAFTIVPGWNMTELRAALLGDHYLFHAVRLLSDTELMARLGLPGFSPEGQFYPDTYYFAEGSSDLSLLRRAFKTMQIKLNTAWLQRDIHLPFEQPYDALIAASLVEKEAYLQSERPVIAGVLINRLHNNMLLQFDPTVIYGMGPHYNGKINKEDLITDTPYNTYLRKGLPPSPIAMPSLGSIMAVLHPTAHLFLYFVARGDGSHLFSKTLLEHNEAVALVKKQTVVPASEGPVMAPLLPLKTQEQTVKSNLNVSH